MINLIYFTYKNNMSFGLFYGKIIWPILLLSDTISQGAEAAGCVITYQRHHGPTSLIIDELQVVPP